MEGLRRVCLLTGASGPLGTAFIERCADHYEIVAVHHGRPVYAATQNQSFVDPLNPAADCASNRHRVHATKADISDRESIDGVVDEVLDTLGRVDLLINAAAVRQFAPLLAATTEAAAETVLRVNVLAPLWLSLGLARAHWRDNPDANVKLNRNVINVSSTAGRFVYEDLGQGLYATSKAALEHLTYHLASEFWDLGIRVNAVAPDTFPGRVPISEVVDAIVALDESRDTGQIVQISREQ
jgi:NAD(P)-dependent dehydrogenase (short-subunit alcohol dehydrogenase family)